MKPQDVTAAHGEFAIFMVLGLREGADAEAKVKQLCGSIGALVRSLRTRLADSEASCVMGFGAEAWGRLFADRSCARRRCCGDPQAEDGFHHALCRGSAGD